MEILDHYKKFLDNLDNGNFFRKPLKWLYMVMAGVNVLAPFAFLWSMIENHAFSHMPAKYVIALILVLIVMFAGFFMLAMLWWNRKDQIEKIAHDAQFPVTPVFAHVIRVFGEWMGLMIGGIGFVVALIALVFMGSGLGSLGLPGFKFMSMGGLSVILIPVYGFLIIVFSRFLSEATRVLVVIAHNTKK